MWRGGDDKEREGDKEMEGEGKWHPTFGEKESYALD